MPVARPPSTRLFLPAIALAVAALPASLATTLPGSAAAAGQCLYVQQITGTKADGMRTVYARTGRKDVWRIDLSADCAPLADGGGKIVISPRGSGSICGARRATMRSAPTRFSPTRRSSSSTRPAIRDLPTTRRSRANRRSASTPARR